MTRSKPKVLIIQPAIMDYRRLVYNGLADKMEVLVVCSSASTEPGPTKYETHEVTHCTYFGFHWQKGLIPAAQALKASVVWIAADVNYLSSIWFSLWCRIKGIKVILHGQGLVKRSRGARLRKWMLKLWVKIADRYVGYADPCTFSMINAGVKESKLSTIRNRLETGQISIPAHSLRTDKQGVLFIGRLRQGCEIEKLIHAMHRINSDGANPTTLHIIGDGENNEVVQKAASAGDWIHWHGRVVDPEQIREISESCSLGVYPGRAGLSVLSYMRSGLAVIVGSDLTQHMGPEPSYVVDGVNGWTFNPSDPMGLEKALRFALTTDSLHRVRSKAIETFNDLHRISYASEMAETIEQVLDVA